MYRCISKGTRIPVGLFVGSWGGPGGEGGGGCRPFEFQIPLYWRRSRLGPMEIHFSTNPAFHFPRCIAKGVMFAMKPFCP